MDNKSLRTILHIDADAFFASVEQAINPNLRNRPVIVGGTANQRGVVHTASYEARKRGVYIGMPLGHARRLVPDAVFLKGHYEHYKAVSDIFEKIYHRYTPAVEFTSLDDAYLDLTGTLNVHRLSPLDVARSIQKEVERATQVSVSCGIGTTKLIARLASGCHKPHGVTFVAPGEELDFLHPLPVEMLPGIGRVAKTTLNQLSVFTVGELSRVPKHLLRQQFGVNGGTFWQLANGIDPRDVAGSIMPKQLSRETGFEEDTSDETVVLDVLRYLTERIGTKLREASLVAQTVSVKIDYTGHRQYKKERSLPRKTSSSDALFSMVRTLVQEAPFRRLRVHRVGLAVSHITRKNLQGDLFDDSSRKDALESAVDQIRRRFGFMAVMPASLINLKQRYRMEKSGYVLHAPALTR